MSVAKPDTAHLHWRLCNLTRLLCADRGPTEHAALYLDSSSMAWVQKQALAQHDSEKLNSPFDAGSPKQFKTVQAKPAGEQTSTAAARPRSLRSSNQARQLAGKVCRAALKTAVDRTCNPSCAPDPSSHSLDPCAAALDSDQQQIAADACTGMCD